jgi:hypothetical protein
MTTQRSLARHRVRARGKATGLGLLALHLGALAAFLPGTFAWPAVAIAVALHYVTGGIGISLGFHRMLTHRSLRCPRWLEYAFALCGTLALQGGPIDWVATHRAHHAHTDREGDPHNVHRGLRWAHIEWLYRYNDARPSEAEQRRLEAILHVLIGPRKRDGRLHCAYGAAFAAFLLISMTGCSSHQTATATAATGEPSAAGEPSGAAVADAPSPAESASTAAVADASSPADEPSPAAATDGPPPSGDPVEAALGSDPAHIAVFVTPYYNSAGPAIQVGRFSSGLASPDQNAFLSTITTMKQQWQH